MGLISIFGTALSAILSGGATGLLGVLLQRFFDLKKQKNDIELLKVNNQHALDMADKSIEQTKAEWASREKIADTEAAAAIEKSKREAMARADEVAGAIQESSYRADKSTYLTGAVLKSKSKVVMWSMALVDAFRGLIRPALTGYLVVITHMMYLRLTDMLAAKGAELPVGVIQELITQVVATLLYLATVSVVWWFGTRPPQQGTKM